MLIINFDVLRCNHVVTPSGCMSGQDYFEWFRFRALETATAPHCIGRVHSASNAVLCAHIITHEGGNYFIRISLKHSGFRKMPCYQNRFMNARGTEVASAGG